MLNQEVITDVFIPNILVKSNSIISIEQNRIKTENISDYNVTTQILNII